jgi:hypothetical protein
MLQLLASRISRCLFAAFACNLLPVPQLSIFAAGLLLLPLQFPRL